MRTACQHEAGAPKCALVRLGPATATTVPCGAVEFFSSLRHLAEEKYKEESSVERPLSQVGVLDHFVNPVPDVWQVNDLMDACRQNHLETITNFNAFKVYKPLPRYLRMTDAFGRHGFLAILAKAPKNACSQIP